MWRLLANLVLGKHLFNRAADIAVWLGEFKDFQAPVLFSSTFKALNLGEKLKYFQGGTLIYTFCLHDNSSLLLIDRAIRRNWVMLYWLVDKYRMTQ